MPNESKMVDFLSQFKLENNFSEYRDKLINPWMLDRAIMLGLVRKFVPAGGPTSCTYYTTIICTPRGRLFVKRLNKLV